MVARRWQEEGLGMPAPLAGGGEQDQPDGSLAWRWRYVAGRGLWCCAGKVDAPARLPQSCLAILNMGLGPDWVGGVDVHRTIKMYSTQLGHVHSHSFVCEASFTARS